MVTEQLNIFGEITHRILCLDPDNLSKTKWNKYIFFIDCVRFNSTAHQKKTLTGATYIKMPYGPVVENFENIIDTLPVIMPMKVVRYAGYSTSNMTFIEKAAEFEKNKAYSYLKELDLNIIDAVISVFKKYTAKQLSDFSHELDAWKQTFMFNEIDFKTTEQDSYLLNLTKKPNLYELIITK